MSKISYQYTYYIIFFIFFINTNLLSQTDFEVTIDLVQSEVSSPQEGFVEALFTISFIPGTENTYLSVGAQDNSTFLFDIIISNLLLPSNEYIGTERHEISQRFNILPLVQNNNPPTMLTCYIHILNGTGFYPFDPSTFKDTKEVVLTEIVDNAVGVKVEEAPVEILPVSPKEHIVDDPLVYLRDRSKASINIDLVNETNGISSTYAGDLNACVPTATANSMHWLNKAYNDITLPESLTPRKTLEELSKYMKRPDGEGATDEEMITGKLDFIEHYELPIEVKFQSEFVDGNIASSSGKSIARNFNVENKKPTWEFFRKMMMDGEDVEINYKWYEPDDNSWPAHSVNVTGFAEYKNGKKKIQIEHDMDQKKSGGTVREILDITADQNVPMRFAREGQRPRYIRTIVAESPIIEEGRETAAWLNEIFGNNNNLNKTVIVQSIGIEVALNENITDLDKYSILVYNGETGLVDSVITLDNFIAGSPSMGLMFYSYTLNLEEISNNHFGIAISYSGSIIENQFISVGGEFTGIDGDATQMLSTDIGSISEGQGLSLSGSGVSYSAYYWMISDNFTAGEVNTNQNYTSSVPSLPQLIEPANGNEESMANLNFMWNTSEFANSYTLEVATDSSFLNIVHMETTILDTFLLIENLTPAQVYYWRVKSENGNGFSEYSEIWNFTITITGVEFVTLKPAEFSLSQNYPNPFNPSTVIKYSIPSNGIVKLSIYDALGSEIAVLDNGFKSAGNYSHTFDASNLSSGMYFYTIRSGNFVQTKKMLLMK